MCVERTVDFSGGATDWFGWRAFKIFVLLKIEISETSLYLQ